MTVAAQSAEVPLSTKSLPAPEANAPLLRAGPASILTYTLVHPLHTVKGVSRKVHCELRLTQDTVGSAIDCWVEVDTFLSGNESRDEQMLKTIEWLEYPEVGFKGKVISRQTGKAGPQWKIAGDISFHGVTRPIQFIADVLAPGQFIPGLREPPLPGPSPWVVGHFKLSLTDHKVIRPVLMFKPTEDTLRLDLRLQVPNP